MPRNDRPCWGGCNSLPSRQDALRTSSSKRSSSNRRRSWPCSGSLRAFNRGGYPFRHQHPLPYPSPALAKELPHPERVAGMHFFNPAPLMRLVEVVQTEYTDEHTIQSLLALAKAMGKTPVLCKDAPGFIVNHVARPYYLEALKLMEEGYGDPETIDAIMESMGFKMGPFRLMDLIGNDVNYAVSDSVYEAMGRPERLRPSPIQEQKVRNGELGRKTGRGYYTY